MKLSKKDMKQILGGEQVPPDYASIVTCFNNDGISICYQFTQPYKCENTRRDYGSICYQHCGVIKTHCVNKPL